MESGTPASPSAIFDLPFSLIRGNSSRVSEANSPKRVAWLPLTPPGVAAFADAPLGRLLFVQLIFALLAASAVVWFLRTAWFPALDAAIHQLPVQGEIRDGRYSIPAETGAAVGWKRVEIQAMRPAGKKTQDPFGSPGKMIDMETSAIAARFNTSSTLRLQVKAGDNEPPTWAVESK